MKISNLTVAHDGVKIIDSVTAEFLSDCECIIGANGAGKSTLVNCIIDKMTYHGEIKDLKSYSYAGSVDDMNTDLSVSEILEYSTTYSGKSDFSLEQILEVFELTYFKNSPFNYLSGGERQRVNLACSLYQNSQTIIWDEPTNYLDPKHIRDLIDIVNKFKTSRQFLIVSHHLNFILCVSNTILGLKCGQLVCHKPSEVFFEEKLFDDIFDMKFTYIDNETLGDGRLIF